MPMTLEGKAAEFVQEEGNQTMVDWKGLAELQKFAISIPERRKFEKIFHNILNYLYSRKVLTYRDKMGSYFLTKRGLLNPRDSSGSYNFVQRSEAIKYAQAFYPHDFPIRLNQVVEILETNSK